MAKLDINGMDGRTDGQMEGGMNEWPDRWSQTKGWSITRVDTSAD